MGKLVQDEYRPADYIYSFSSDDSFHITKDIYIEEGYGDERFITIAAPLASELMEWIKERYRLHNLTAMEVMSLIMNWVSGYNAKSLPNALMQMCIARKEEENGKG